VALFLRNKGYQAFAIEGGLVEWKDQGYPIEKKD